MSCAGGFRRHDRPRLTCTAGVADLARIISSSTRTCRAHTAGSRESEIVRAWMYDKVHKTWEDQAVLARGIGAQVHGCAGAGCSRASPLAAWLHAVVGRVTLSVCAGLAHVDAPSPVATTHTHTHTHRQCG
jgi:hypothetical protein